MSVTVCIKTFYEAWETLEPVTEIITVKGYELINIKIKLDQKDACKFTILVP